LWPSGPERSSKKLARVAVAIFRTGSSGEALRAAVPGLLMPSIMVLSDVPRTDLISKPLIAVMFRENICIGRG